MILGLDYDDTITSYPDALGVIARAADEVYVITLNHKVGLLSTARLLGCRIHGARIMPDEAFDTTAEDVGVGKWKAEMCRELGVDLMIDDLASVCEECEKAGIAALQVHLKE